MLYAGGAWPGVLADTGVISVAPYTVADTQSCGLGYWGASGSGPQEMNSFELLGTAPGDGIELTDGVIGSATDFHDAAWQGHQDLASPLDQTVDLGSSQSLSAFRSLYYLDPGAGIYRPTSVEVLTSPDNTTYTSRGTTLSASASNVSGALWQYDLSVTPISAIPPKVSQEALFSPIRSALTSAPAMHQRSRVIGAIRCTTNPNTIRPTVKLAQYDNESRLLGFQSRFRWILKPGNDLFVVINRGWAKTLDGSFDSSFDRASSKLQYTFRF